VSEVGGAAERVAAARAALARAPGTSGAARATLLREISRALFAAGDEPGGAASAREAFEAWPADDAAFVEALRYAAADVQQLDSVLRARAHALPKEAPACHRARADALLAFGRPGDAVAAYRACLATAPQDAGALRGLAEAAAELGDGDAALAAARHLADVTICADEHPSALALVERLASRFGRGAS
jgi:hypothetical protein